MHLRYLLLKSLLNSRRWDFRDSNDSVLTRHTVTILSRLYRLYDLSDLIVTLLMIMNRIFKRMLTETDERSRNRGILVDMINRMMQDMMVVRPQKALKAPNV